MNSRSNARRLAILLLVILLAKNSSMCVQPAVAEVVDLAKRPVLEITADTTLDPKQTYGAIVITKSGVTLDGQGAWLIGSAATNPKQFTGTAIDADGVSGVTLKNVNAKGWETGLRIRNADQWIVQDCDFSDNFHDPEFGWGENGRRGGIVLENVHKSVLRNNKARRVWDACVLFESNDNLLHNNDFSHTSNTCLKLWTARRNTIHHNQLSHGIRISSGEVHARDSTSVLIESGSNDNRLLNNDCTHGGDGIFVRVLNAWCSTGNYFEGNDCSYANNNGIECWAPHNVFVKNKANHCSYGFWMGGSDKTRLIDNEASFNGLASGQHNSPHLPDNGHAGIVFMFGTSSHTLARGNICRGNNGAGIALIGDLASQGKKWKAYHWVLQHNRLTDNRWGIYAKHADWITMVGNQYDGNTVKDVLLDGDVTRYTESDEAAVPSTPATRVAINGPAILMAGATGTWEIASESDPTSRSPMVTWDLGDGRLRNTSQLRHNFERVGFHRIGANLGEGSGLELAWRDVYVVRAVRELGTEGDTDNWTIEDFHDRTRSDLQSSKAAFRNTERDLLDSGSVPGQPNHLVGKSALHVTIDPYAGFRAALTYPKDRDAAWPLAGKQRLTFWLKSINSDVTGWQGGPFVVVHGDDRQCYIEPNSGHDLMREMDHSEERAGWRRFEIPLNGDDRWRREGDLPTTARAVSLCFDSWGAPPLQIWIDGLAFE